MGAAAMPEIMAAVGQIGAAGVSGALQPDPYQKRVSYSGTGADPAGWLSDVRATTSNLMKGWGDHMGESVEIPYGDLLMHGRDAAASGYSGSGGSPRRVQVEGFTPPTTPGRPALGTDSGARTPNLPMRLRTQMPWGNSGIFGTMTDRGQDQFNAATTDLATPDRREGQLTHFGPALPPVPPGRNPQTHGAASLLLQTMLDRARGPQGVGA